MNFVDATFLRLAGDDQRASLFDAVSLEQIVSAAYDVDQMPVEGPFSATFDEVRLGYPVRPPITIEGAWTGVAPGERCEATFAISSIGTSETRVDAIWRGSVIARARLSASRIDEATVAWPSLGSIDDEVIRRLGSLPTDPALLEEERRASLATRIRSELGDPESFDDVLVDKWLAEQGVESVGQLIELFRGTEHPAVLNVVMSKASTPASSPVALPVVAALLIRDVGFSVAELVATSQAVPDQLDALGLRRARREHLPQRRPLLVVWMLPPEVFDDPAWPGAGATMTPEAARAARRAHAGQWLAREGIGLAIVEPAT